MSELAVQEISSNGRRSHLSVAIFIEWANIEASLKQIGLQPDAMALRDYLTEGRELQECFVYAGIHPEHEEQCRGFHNFLRRSGFVVRVKKGKPNGEKVKMNFDVDIAVDALRYTDVVHPDIVVIGAGDGDFAPLAAELRMRGIRVEVAATQNSLSGELLEAASDFIDLEVAYEQMMSWQENQEGGNIDEDGNC